MTSGPESPSLDLRTRLRTGRPTTFALLSFPDAGVATLLGWSGCDVVLIDAEHGPFTLESIRACLDAISTTPAATIVRVPDEGRAYIKQVLELGPQAILVPAVSVPEQAVAAVQACRYPPEGVRGVGTGRAARYGLASAAYRSVANDRTAVLVMIETVEGAKNTAAIARTPGLDGIFIGPHDLGADMGLLQEPRHPEIDAAVIRIAEEVARAGLPVGVHASPSELPRYLELGMSLFLCFTDFAGLAVAARTTFDDVRATVGRS
jgi:4-hydroxy-2-oxoheptanedioate aldolase